MTLLRNVETRQQDTQDLDAFGRVRASEPFNIFDMQFNYDLQPLFWEGSVVGGGGVSHVPNLSAARLTTGGTTDTHGAIFQTKQYFRYQPGKSQFIVFTCIFGAKVANVRRRIGLFDGENGFFWEQDETNLKIVRRTKTSGSVVDNEVNQSSWNLDVLDGNGGPNNPSGVLLDESKDNLFVIDYQWLGAGRIRFGFDFGGQILYVHQIKFANTEAVPFTVTGNLPFRAEIFNTDTAGGATTFDFTCVAIVSEGGHNPLGIPVSVQNTVRREVTSVNEPLPILSIRPKTTFNSITNRGLVIPKSFALLSEDASIRYEIILNGSLTNPSWSDVNATHSMVEKDVAATAISGGLVIASGFLTGVKDKAESGNVNEELMSKLALANDIVGTTTDILTIAVSTMSADSTSTDCAGSFTWKEER